MIEQSVLSSTSFSAIKNTRMKRTFLMAGHCRRYANLRPDKTGDCETQYGVCLSATTGGLFGEVGVDTVTAAVVLSKMI